MKIYGLAESGIFGEFSSGFGGYFSDYYLFILWIYMGYIGLSDRNSVAEKDFWRICIMDCCCWSTCCCRNAELVCFWLFWSSLGRFL